MERLLGMMGQREELMAIVTPNVGPVLGKRLETMGDASLFNLVTGMLAAGTAGVSGDLVIRVPRKLNDRMEVYWRSAPIE